jgi:hypothetical protein
MNRKTTELLWLAEGPKSGLRPVEGHWRRHPVIFQAAGTSL